MHNLRGEIANDVGSVAAPKGADALILVHARGAVDDALCTYSKIDLLSGVLSYGVLHEF